MSSKRMERTTVNSFYYYSHIHTQVFKYTFINKPENYSTRFNGRIGTPPILPPAMIQSTWVTLYMVQQLFINTVLALEGSNHRRIGTSYKQQGTEMTHVTNEAYIDIGERIQKQDRNGERDETHLSKEAQRWKEMVVEIFWVPVIWVIPFVGFVCLFLFIYFYFFESIDFSFLLIYPVFN